MNLFYKNFIGSNYLHSFKEYALGKEWILFGASVAGRHAANFLRKIGAKPKFYCDNDSKKWKKSIGGFKICDPSKIIKEKDPNVLITSSQVIPIKEQLISMGIKNIFNLPGLGSIGNIHDLFDGDYIKNNSDKINQLINLLDDEVSLKTVDNILCARLTGDFNFFKKVYNEKLFFPEKIFEFTNDETFLDAGSYRGEIIRLFINQVNGSFKKINAFEPDNSNYNYLKKNIRKWGIKDRSNIYNMALYNKNCNLDFNISDIETQVEKESNNGIKAVTIDEFFDQEKNTFIKIHVQGCEINVLEGAQEIISKNKPKLAVVINQKPKDLWLVPLKIKSMNNDYRIYIRHHSVSSVYTVCYAT